MFSIFKMLLPNLFNLFYSLLLFGLLVEINGKLTRTREWKHSSNFRDKNNWINGNSPCNGSTIVFPTELDAVILLPKTDNKFEEIVLPMFGEILIQDESQITLGDVDVPDKDCNRNVDSQFKPVKREAWLNPSSWSTKEKQISAPNQYHYWFVQELDENKAVPHLEQIPCQHDLIIFPTEPPFEVLLPEVPIQTNTIQILGHKFTFSAQFNDFLFSNIGEDIFANSGFQQRNEIISVVPKNCTDKTGCECHPLSGSEFENLKTTVCTHHSSAKEKALCLTPVQPIGFCWPVCGSTLLMEFKPSFNIEKFEKYVADFLYMTNYFDIDYYISKVHSDNQVFIQTVFRIQGKYDTRTNDVANRLLEEIENDDSLGLHQAKVKLSGLYYNPSTGIAPFKFIFGTFMTVLLTIAIIFVIYYPVRDIKLTRPQGLSTVPFPQFNRYVFSRFGNTPEDGTLEFNTRLVTHDEFENPLSVEDPHTVNLHATLGLDQDVEEVTFVEISSESDADDTELVDLSTKEE